MLAWLYTIAQRRFADDTRRRLHALDGLPADDALDELPAREADVDVDGALSARSRHSRLASARSSR